MSNSSTIVKHQMGTIEMGTLLIMVHCPLKVYQSNLNAVDQVALDTIAVTPRGTLTWQIHLI